VTGITRDKEYDITQGTAGSKVVYFTSNPNAEAEVIRVALKPKPRLNKLVLEKDFSDIAIKGRQSMGNILTKNDVHKITLKQKGGSTLGGRQVWFDRDVLRLNYDNRGEYLGEFLSDDLILVVSTTGEYRTTSFDLSNHFTKDILYIEKFDANKVWSVVLFDADQNYYYLKRFQLEVSQKIQSFLGENAQSRLMLMSDIDFPRFEVVFGGTDAYREALIVDAEEFIGVKSLKARGKRLTTFEVESINELEPLRFASAETGNSNDSGSDDNSNENGSGEAVLNEESEIEVVEQQAESTKEKAAAEVNENDSVLPDEIVDQNRIIDDINGQLTLF
ncbi:MAG: DNA gyrase/topoisomerase IV subunit A, partial [Paludibacter sp.]|nr:DNA gyrase/topoisomerase IV subunit A [Paludibacter sp.]